MDQLPICSQIVLRDRHSRVIRKHWLQKIVRIRRIRCHRAKNHSVYWHHASRSMTLQSMGPPMKEARGEQLDDLWLQLKVDANSEAAFLRELSYQRVFVILKQPPGPGPARPEKNMVYWQRRGEEVSFIPLFTSARHITFTLPPPTKLVYVFSRDLIAAGGDQRYVVNPLSGSPYDIHGERLALLRTYIAEDHHDSEWPSPHAPWVFRLPEDALFPVAVALAQWFNQSGRVDEAFLYELTRGQSPRMQIILGLNEPADKALADQLLAIAHEAGADSTSFVVRFLPDEPSHREGIAQAGLTPFYQRPQPSDGKAKINRHGG